MRARSFFCICAALALALLSFWLALWPLALAALALALLCGNVASALVIALCCDILWGAPGEFHTIFALPLTLITALLGSARIYVASQMRRRVPEAL